MIIDAAKNRIVFIKVYCSVFSRNYKQNGFVWFFKKSISKFFLELAWVSLLPIAICAHVYGFRRLLVRSEHIGHLAVEFDTFIKEKELCLISSRHFYFTLAPEKKVSNSHLLSYWQEKLWIVTNPMVCQFLEILTRRFFVRYDVSHYTSSFFGTQEVYRINKLWGNRQPVLKLNMLDEEWGRREFNKIGITDDQWFVCLHVREGGFLPHNELIQSHRNANIENYFIAIHEIVNRGGLVVRMGDQSMTPLPAIRGVIDYAHLPNKSDRMDVILCAKARFFLGCTSGLAFLSMIFGVPIAHANMIPVETLGIRASDISMPKLLRSKSTNCYIHFNEVLSTSVGGFFFTYQYIDAGIQIIDNTSDEILLLVCEMLDRLEGVFIESAQSRHLHDQFMALFKPGHYSYGAISRVCLGFLKKYQHLL